MSAGFAKTLPTPSAAVATPLIVFKTSLNISFPLVSLSPSIVLPISPITEVASFTLPANSDICPASSWRFLVSSSTLPIISFCFSNCFSSASSVSKLALLPLSRSSVIAFSKRAASSTAISRTLLSDPTRPLFFL